jgi:hypothetical protein
MEKCSIFERAAELIFESLPELVSGRSEILRQHDKQVLRKAGELPTRPDVKKAAISLGF